MRLKLERTWCGPKCSIGTLCVDGITECFTLEDVQREIPGAPVPDWKVPGRTAIPKGLYTVTITYSERFKRELPLLEGVQGFSGVRIHPGNTAEDTEGCILVGKTKGPDFVGESRAAFAELFVKLERALQAGENVTLEIA
jgi:hypothetical protein